MRSLTLNKKKKKRATQKKPPANAQEQLLFDHLMEAIKKTGIEIRIEKGDFKGGMCIINGEERIMFLNRKDSLEKINNILLSELKSMSHQQLYLPPLLREKIEQNQNQS